MKTPQKEVKPFTFLLILWGLLQVICGLAIIVTVMDFCDHILFPLKNPVFVFAASLSFINGGSCTLAFAFFRGKFVWIVLATSIISTIFGASMSILLTVSRHRNTLGHNEETVYRVQLTIGLLIALGNSFSAIFYSLFRSCRLASTPGHLVHFVKEIDNPSYYQQTLQFIKCQVLNWGSASSFGAIRTQESPGLPPVYTIDDWKRYEADNLDKCDADDKVEKLPPSLPAFIV